MSEGEYAISANLAEPDGSFRMGAKCWLAGGENGDGGERFEWVGMSIGGRRITKWAPTARFENFRVQWVPEHLRSWIHIRGTKEEMTARLNRRDFRPPPEPPK